MMDSFSGVLSVMGAIDGDPSLDDALVQPAGTSDQIAVECKDVTKEFGAGETRVQVLKGINARVREDELTLLVGPSGCGKTTLISIIAGLLLPTTGTVRVMGTDLSSLSPSQLVRFRGHAIGFVFQQYNLLPALTAVENVAVPLIISGWKRTHAIDRAAEMIGEVGLQQRMRAFPREMSGGQQQRVAIARALVHEPRLLVCDEPTAALDADSGMNVMRLLRETTVRPGRAVIVVTHDQRVLQFGQQTIHMADGVIADNIGQAH